MIRILPVSPIAALVLVLSPVTAFSQATPAPAELSAAEAAVVQAFVQFDCVMTNETEDAVVAAMGISEAESEVVGQQMFASGMLREVGETLVLVHPDCPASAAVAAQPGGMEAAVAWMNALTPVQSADVLAEMMTRRGCQIMNDDFRIFEGEVSAAVGNRFGFDQTALLAEDMDIYLTALDAMGERGGDQMVAEGRVQDMGDRIQLVSCIASGVEE